MEATYVGTPCGSPSESKNGMGKIIFLERGALLDASGQYRFWLSRQWDKALPTVTFVLLNPSTADAQVDDPTLRKCAQFARLWGYGSLMLVNLFAYRATRPQDLLKAADPVGGGNNTYILEAAKGTDRMVVAWGNYGKYQNRDQEVLQLLASYPLYCLGWTHAGQPRHPVRLAYQTPLVRFLGYQQGGILREEHVQLKPGSYHAPIRAG